MGDAVLNLLLPRPSQRRVMIGFVLRREGRVRHAPAWLQMLLSLLMLVTAPACLGLAEGGETATQADRGRVQVLEGELSGGELRIYRLKGLMAGDRLYVSASATSGNLDPLICLLKYDAGGRTLDTALLHEEVRRLSEDHDAITVTSLIMERHALAWNDDYQGHYDAAFDVEIREDGDYSLAVGSSLVRASAGSYRLMVGIDAPSVLAGEGGNRGSPFVFADEAEGLPGRRIVLVTGELQSRRTLRYYNLTDLPAGQTFYSYAETISGDLKPTLTLLDFSDKAVAYGNFAAKASQAFLEYVVPRRGRGYRLEIAGGRTDAGRTSGDFRLLMGLNTPEVLRGEGESTGKTLLREPIPVGIGVKMQQITEVDQKEENFGVVANLVLHWRDPALAYDPELVNDRFRVFMGEAFAEEMNRRGQTWPQFTIVNQQGNRWIQNRVAVVRPDGESVYLERFSTTLQAPDFDFRDFPFDVQKFFIRVDLLTPDWMFHLHPIEGYSEVGEKLGEEEWVVTEFDTVVSQGHILERPVSRFDFEFRAKRHVAYYFFRILLPLVVIIAVSWVLFFLKDYGKRVDAAGANMLLFIAFNFTISSDLPRLGYLTFLDTLLISAFLVTAVVLILSVYLRRQDMNGRGSFVAKVDRYVILFYPLAYVLTIASVAWLFR